MHGLRSLLLAGAVGAGVAYSAFGVLHPWVTGQRFVAFAAPAPDGGACAVDTVEGESMGAKPAFVRLHADSLRLQGWAIDDAQASPPADVAVVLEGPSGQRFIATAQRRPRPDVAVAFKRPDYAQAGFELVEALLDVPDGTYRLTLVQGRGQQRKRCDLRTQVQIDAQTRRTLVADSKNGGAP